MHDLDYTNDIEHLLKIAKKIDGSGYGASRNLIGSYIYENHVRLDIDHVPRDPSDQIPGKIKLIIPFKELGYDATLIKKSKLSIIASKHFFTELTYRTLRYEGRRWMWMEPPGQAFLERNSVIVNDNAIEIRLDFVVPYKGRKRISGGRLRRLITDTIPRIIDNIKCTTKKREILVNMIHTIEDQEYLRNKLREEEFIAFIADGSILPRQGNSDFPLKNALPFRAPKDKLCVFDLPNRGSIYGLCLEKGKIISFAGANFHGKTTILNALLVAHYNHVPGDGREFVISIDELPLIAAENRRIIRGIDLSLFMRNIPGIEDVKFFSTNEASGSTSQAAAIIEALEFGAPGILIDEDSSAVNLLLKDKILARLVPKDLEPITPLIELIDTIKQYGTSVIFAIGALGELLLKSDYIFLVRNFSVSKVLTKQQLTSHAFDKTKKITSSKQIKINPAKRIPKERSIPDGKITTISYDEIGIRSFGREIKLNLRGAIKRTLKERAQVRALALAIKYASRYADGKTSLKEIVDYTFNDISEYGLDILNPNPEVSLNLALFTKYQLFYSLSRLPTLKIKERKNNL